MRVRSRNMIVRHVRAPFFFFLHARHACINYTLARAARKLSRDKRLQRLLIMQLTRDRLLAEVLPRRVSLPFGKSRRKTLRGLRPSWPLFCATVSREVESNKVVSVNTEHTVEFLPPYISQRHRVDATLWHAEDTIVIKRRNTGARQR